MFFCAIAAAAELVVSGYQGEETLKGFPVAVRLADSAAVSFFSPDGTTEYPSERDGDIAWVRLPELRRGTTFQMRKGAAKAAARGVWGTANGGRYAGVWHFGETDATAPAVDAAKTSDGLDAVPQGAGKGAMVGVGGIAGGARILSASEASYFEAPAKGLRLGGRFTFSGWVKGDRINPFKLIRLVSRSNDKCGYGGNGGWAVGIQSADSIQICGPSNRFSAAGADFSDDAWHHIAVVYDDTAFRVFVDGEPRAAKQPKFSCPVHDEDASLKFGWRVATPSNPITLRGAVDEFRLLTTPVSADWAKAEYDNLANPNFVTAKGAPVPPAPKSAAPNVPQLPVIPRVLSWTPSSGSVRVARTVEGRDADGKAVAAQLADDLRVMFGEAAESAPCGVVLSVDPQVSANPEGYRMEITALGVAVVGATRQGVYWGTRTLLQLLDAAADKQTIACGTVVDAPKYRRRGFMLDVARKFFPLAYLRDVAKTMAYYKMNDFHVHLNDNGGREIADSWDQIYSAFRMECETYPDLTAKDGFYRKDEFRAFVKDAAKIGVQVVPEFDAPAHSLAFTRCRPDFEKKDHDPAHIELKNPDVIPFFEKLWAEYLGGDDPVFAGPVVHVGSDEYWAKEAELFRAFLDRMLAVVQSYGKTPRAWGSLTHCHGTTKVRSDGVEMDIWYNPYYGPAAALRAGYGIIAVPDNELYICPACGYYNDYLNLPMIYKYWEPKYIGNDEVAENEPKLLGGAFAVWNDHIGNGISCDDVTDRAFPALQTMAEKLWHGTDRTLAYENFAARADAMAEAPGVNQRDRVKLAADGTADISSSAAIGWTQRGGWTVAFDLTLEPDQPVDAPLFDDGTTLVSANLGGTGRFGFRRDGYDCLFKDPLPTGRKLAVKMTGDPKGTSLYLGGALVERLQKPMRVVTKKGYKMAQVETLHFPLVRAANAKAKVENFSARPGL